MSWLSGPRTFQCTKTCGIAPIARSAAEGIKLPSFIQQENMCTQDIHEYVYIHTHTSYGQSKFQSPLFSLRSPCLGKPAEALQTEQLQCSQAESVASERSSATSAPYPSSLDLLLTSRIRVYDLGLRVYNVGLRFRLGFRVWLLGIRI